MIGYLCCPVRELMLAAKIAQICGGTNEVQGSIWPASFLRGDECSRPLVYEGSDAR